MDKVTGSQGGGIPEGATHFKESSATYIKLNKPGPGLSAYSLESNEWEFIGIDHIPRGYEKITVQDTADEIIEMNDDHIVIDADSLPLDMFRQIPDPYPGCDVAIYFNDDKSWHGAWWKGIELKISGKDALELDGMVGFYQDNARQDAAEEGI